MIGDRYATYRTIGEGQQGKVKFGTDLVNNKAESIRRHVFIALREHEFMSLIDHPNIIKSGQLISDTSKIYIVMEYIDSYDLFGLIRKLGKIPEKDCCKIFQQIVRAVDYLHKNSIVHKDLKLENILVGKEKQVVKIIDFGYASIFSHLNKDVTYYGTLSYSSPEALEEIPHLGPSSDVWSLGVILYTMVAGYKPFKGNSRSSILKKIKSNPVIYPDHFSATLIDLLNQIFAVDYSKRVGTSEIQKHSWVNQTHNYIKENNMLSRMSLQ
ncbi:kinase-like domain-containing protein [Phycomyces blakesleeanus]|uniref:Kinase-like domain-containing protein n=2 Tax=Phycomyces blakesleeanus TaxID=4837 RepID=A0ABR3BAV1_PHYBL